MVRKNSTFFKLSLLVFWYCCVPVFSLDPTTDALPYLRTGLGGKALGLGGAFVSVADDASATYWNPAGLVFLRNKEVQFTYSLLSLDRHLGAVNFVIPGKTISFGTSLINAGVSGIKEYDSAGTYQKPFGYNSTTVILSFAQKVQKKVSIGINGKMIYDILNDNTRVGGSLDLAVLSNPWDKLTFGVKLQDIVSFLDKDTIPLNIVFGVAYRLFNETLLVSADIVKVSDTDTLKLRTGGVYNFGKLFYLAAGVNEYDLSFGFGVNWDWVNVYYVYLVDKIKAGDKNILTLSLKF